MTAVPDPVRIQMIRKLAGLVGLPASKIDSHERRLAADILSALLEGMPREIRMEVAEHAGRIGDCPAGLLRMLLLDEADVAGLVLPEMDAISPSILIEVAGRMSQAHRMMIAGRRNLQGPVVDACAAHGERDVCCVLLRNHTHELSSHTLDWLVALGSVHPEIQTLLLKRDELEPAHAFIMFWWADRKLRRSIVNRFTLDRRLIQDAFDGLYESAFGQDGNGCPDPLVQEMLILAERRYRTRAMTGAEAVPMDTIKSILSLVPAYDRDRFADFKIVDALAVISGLSASLVRRIVDDEGGEPFAVFCKSIGISRRSFSGFYDRERGGAEKGEYMLEFFDSIARDCARAIVRYWNWDSNPRIREIKKLSCSVQGDGNAR